MVLGHEVSGTVTSVGTGVPCGQCAYSQQGLCNQCLDMRFYGSAMRFPHVHGAFWEEIVIAEAQAFHRRRCDAGGVFKGANHAAVRSRLSVRSPIVRPRWSPGRVSGTGGVTW